MLYNFCNGRREVIHDYKKHPRTPVLNSATECQLRQVLLILRKALFFILYNYCRSKTLSFELLPGR